VIVDGHEDLAYNVLVDGRDYLTSAHAIRHAEEGTSIEEVTGRCMLGLREWLEARVAVIVATVTTIPHADAHPGELAYETVEASHQQALAQLAIYRRWASEHPQIAIVANRGQLEDVVASWNGSRPRVGLVLLMENADSIRDVGEVAFWAAQGIRLIGPAWHTNRWSSSSRDAGGLTQDGRRLLEEMGRLGLVLDLTHMSDDACEEALARYEGTVVATHANPRRLVPIPRNLPDRVIEGIVARDGVVGIMPANWALSAGWRRETGKEAVRLGAVVDAIDAVCQLAGDALHVALGTDFDGGFGAETAPAELDTIADLPKLADVLAAQGYADDDVRAVMGGNWLRMLGGCLPA